MLSNAYFLAKFRFDTAENEPAKNLQNFRKMHFLKTHFRLKPVEQVNAPPDTSLIGAAREARSTAGTA